MGLLDTLMNGTGDAERDNAMYRGILAAGLQLMQAKGKGLFPAIGQAGMTGLGAADQYTQQRQAAQVRDQQRQMAALQLQNAQREQQIAQLPGRFTAPGGGMAVDATGGMDTATTNPNNVARPEGEFDQAGYLQALRGLDFNKYLQTAAALQKERAKLMNVAPGGAVFDPETGKEVYKAPFKPAEQSPPSAVLEYQFAVQQGYKGSFEKWKQEQKPAGVSVSYGSPVAGMDAQGNPVFFQPDKGGGKPAIIPGVAPPKSDKPMTEAQAKAATFKSQMEAAEKELSSLPLDMSKVWNQADVLIANGAGNFAASPVAQRARQAQEQWSESFLRFKTGAAATADEVRMNVRTFFPQPGDSKDVIAQKKRARDQAMKDMEFAATGKQPAASTPDNDPLGLRGR